MTIIYSKTPTRKRPKRDFYETPYEVAYAALEFVTVTSKDTILDIGAGEGAWGYAARKRFGAWPNVVGIELEDKHPKYVKHYDAWFVGDITDGQEHYTGKADIVIGNPPFSLAEEFIRFGLSKQPREMLLLLPLNFLGSQKRGKGLFQEYPPYKVIVSSRRISFFKTEKSNTGDYDCALFYWKHNNYNYDCQNTKLYWWDYKSDV